MIPLNEYIARMMYDAYCEVVGGKAFNGTDLPSSIEFFADPEKKKQAAGWIAAADVAIEELEGGEKTLHNSDISGAKENVPDIKVVGDGDMFQLLCKASSEREGWMKSTKAMEVPGGCVVQATTQQRNPDGSYSVAEALTFVPYVGVAEGDCGGRKLVSLQ